MRKRSNCGCKKKNSAKQTPKGNETHKHIHACKYFLAILKKFYEIIGRKQVKSAHVRERIDDRRIYFSVLYLCNLRCFYCRQIALHFTYIHTNKNTHSYGRDEEAITEIHSHIHAFALT